MIFASAMSSGEDTAAPNAEKEEDEAAPNAEKELPSVLAAKTAHGSGSKDPEVSFVFAGRAAPGWKRRSKDHEGEAAPADELATSSHFADASAGPEVTTSTQDVVHIATVESQEEAYRHKRAQMTFKDMREVTDLGVPEELVVLKDVGPGRASGSDGIGSLILTWFYAEDVLDNLADPSCPVRSVYFEIRQRAEVGGGRQRTRIHTCQCQLPGNDEPYGAQRFVIDGCTEGRLYTLDVRALVEIDHVPCIVASQWSHAVEARLDSSYSVSPVHSAAVDACTALLDSITTRHDCEQLKILLEKGQRTLSELEREQQRQTVINYETWEEIGRSGAQDVQALQALGDHTLKQLSAAAGHDLHSNRMASSKCEPILELTEDSLSEQASPRKTDAALEEPADQAGEGVETPVDSGAEKSCSDDRHLPCTPSSVLPTLIAYPKAGDGVETPVDSGAEKSCSEDLEPHSPKGEGWPSFKQRAAEYKESLVSARKEAALPDSSGCGSPKQAQRPGGSPALSTLRLATPVAAAAAPAATVVEALANFASIRRLRKDSSVPVLLCSSSPVVRKSKSVEGLKVPTQAHVGVSLKPLEPPRTSIPSWALNQQPSPVQSPTSSTRGRLQSPKLSTRGSNGPVVRPIVPLSSTAGPGELLRRGGMANASPSPSSRTVVRERSMEVPSTRRLSGSPRSTPVIQTRATLPANSSTSSLSTVAYQAPTSAPRRSSLSPGAGATPARQIAVKLSGSPRQQPEIARMQPQSGSSPRLGQSKSTSNIGVLPPSRLMLPASKPTGSPRMGRPPSLTTQAPAVRSVVAREFFATPIVRRSL